MLPRSKNMRVQPQLRMSTFHSIPSQVGPLAVAQDSLRLSASGPYAERNLSAKSCIEFLEAGICCDEAGFVTRHEAEATKD
jgi:hypothetical protein